MSVASTPKVKTFTADSEGGARATALDWLSDFSQHGTIHSRGLTVTRDGDKFIAKVEYTD